MLDDISNKITDLILKGADWSEISPLVEESMRIMDAKKEN